MTWNQEELSKAIILYFGYGVSVSPTRDNAKVLSTFGKSKGQDLLGHIDQLNKEINQISVDWTKSTLAEAGDAVRAKIHARFPDLTSEALDAIAWDFTFNWR